MTITVMSLRILSLDFLMHNLGSAAGHAIACQVSGYIKHVLYKCIHNGYITMKTGTE